MTKLTKFILGSTLAAGLIAGSVAILAAPTNTPDDQSDQGIVVSQPPADQNSTDDQAVNATPDDQNVAPDDQDANAQANPDQPMPADVSE